jgi:hypothetical protein
VHTHTLGGRWQTIRRLPESFSRTLQSSATRDQNNAGAKVGRLVSAIMISDEDGQLSLVFKSLLSTIQVAFSCVTED